MKVFWVSKRLAFASAITSYGHVRKLQGLGVTHVINLRHGKHGKKIRQFESLWLPFRDDMEPRPEWFHRRALRFYQKAMRHPNSKVICMCHHGACRSPSMVYFLLRVEGLSPARAKAVVFKARKCARVVPAYQESGEYFLSLYKMKQIINGSKS